MQNQSLVSNIFQIQELASWSEKRKTISARMGVLNSNI